MVQQVEETHAEEEERFRKLQVQDAASLNDRLDTLIVIKNDFEVQYSFVSFDHNFILFYLR